MKNKRRIIGIVAAMLLAVIGTIALVGYVQSAKDKAVAQEALVDVYVVDKLVPNVRKLGLLDANDGYLRKAWGEAGLLEFEFADDTGSDYDSYDAVAADRRAAPAS